MKKLLLIILLCPFIFSAQNKIVFNSVEEEDNGLFGYRMSLSANGNIIAISSPDTDVNGDRSGSVRVYKNNNGIWEQLGATINGERRFSTVGTSVKLSSDGNILAIAANGTYNGIYLSGFVRVYRNNDDVWEQIGNTIKGFEELGYLGYSLSLSSNGNILAATSRNKIKVYKINGEVWEQMGDTIEDVATAGIVVSLSSDGNSLAIGSSLDDRYGFRSGYVRVLKYINNIWEQIGTDIYGDNNEYFGRSVDLSSDGNTLLVAAMADNRFRLGYIKIFKNNNGIWEQLGNDINGININIEDSISFSSDGSSFVTANNDGEISLFKNNNGVWNKSKNLFEFSRFNRGPNYYVDLSSDGNTLAISNPLSARGFNTGTVYILDLRTILSTENSSISNFSIYPNPATNQIKIQLNNSTLKKVLVFNNLGQLVKTSTKSEIITSNLSKGIYILQVETNQGKVTKKLIIE